jgi:hypothetical protein
MDANSHYEIIKKVCQEAKLPVEERPKQKWGANYKKGTVEYNVLRVAGNRCDFLFDQSGKLVSVSQ